MITSQNNRFSMGGYRSFLIAAGAMLAAATALATTIDPSNYNYSMTIAPASGQVTSTLTNFPVLVRLSSARQSGFNPADCGANGADLRFALFPASRWSGSTSRRSRPRLRSSPTGASSTPPPRRW